MATPTDIVNVALRRIGANRISSLENDAHKEAVVARDLYHDARRDVLNTHHWNFAIKRAALTVSATAPAFGWDYAFPLPTDFIRLISAHPTDNDDAQMAYKLEYQSSDDRVLLTDSSTVYIKYIWDLEDANLFSAVFRDALAFRLARDFAGALSKSSAAAELADVGYRKALSRAKSIDGIEDWPERMAEGNWVNARHPDRTA